MGFKLSTGSIEKLTGVKSKMVLIVGRAITKTKIDFGVTQGLRTIEEQKEYVASGASQTMKSKHLTGDAVDLVAYMGSRISWEITLYDDLADAMVEAAKEIGVGLRWGAAWHIPDITKYNGTMQEATDEYIDLRRSQGKRPFIDAPHFELA